MMLGKLAAPLLPQRATVLLESTTDIVDPGLSRLTLGVVARLADCVFLKRTEGNLCPNKRASRKFGVLELHHTPQADRVEVSLQDEARSEIHLPIPVSGTL